MTVSVFETELEEDKYLANTVPNVRPKTKVFVYLTVIMPNRCALT